MISINKFIIIVLFSCLSTSLAFGSVSVSSITSEIQSKVIQKILIDNPEVIAENIIVNIKPNTLNPSIPENCHSYSYKIFNKSNLLGRTFIPVYLLDKNNKRIKKIPLIIDSDAKAIFYRTNKKIKIGNMIKKQDIYKVTESLIGKSNIIYNKIDNIVGKEAKINILKDSLLTSQHIRSIPDIYKGNNVLIVLKKGSLELKTKGKSLDDGIIGDKIMVQTLGMSRKLLKGEIIDKDKVQVNIIN